MLVFSSFFEIETIRLLLFSLLIPMHFKWVKFLYPTPLFSNLCSCATATYTIQTRKSKTFKNILQPWTISLSLNFMLPD